jgi:polyhydroxybutyrate depolymerase
MRCYLKNQSFLSHKIKLFFKAGIVLFLILYSTSGYAQDSAAGSFEFDGYLRNYEVFLPHNFQPNMPMVLVLHGCPSTIELFKRETVMHEIADTLGFVVVYAQAIDNCWSIGPDTIDYSPNTDDVGFLSALIDTVHAHFDVDLKRIYSCGHSSGGMMSFRMAGECGQRFAAVAGIGSTLFDESNKWQCIRPLPVLQMHGTEDPWLPYIESYEGFWSAPEMIDFWLNTLQCGPQTDTLFFPDIVKEDTLNPPSGNSQVQKISWTDCAGDNEFVHYKIINGGHQWPGAAIIYESRLGGNYNKDINAGVEILNFFQKHENPYADIAFGKSTNISKNYISRSGDSLIVTAEIANPANHSATVYGIINGETSSFQDSVQLFDDGHHHDGKAADDLWGGALWLSGIEEDLFEVRLRTRDLDEGTKHDIHLGGREYFTSIGPVSWDKDEYELLNFNDSLYTLKLSLRNESDTHTIVDVSARLTTSDPNVTAILQKTQAFPDIEPLQTVQCNGVYSFYAKKEPQILNFRLEIASEGHYWWEHSLDIETAIGQDDLVLPEIFALYQNHPNPFNPTTAIGYQLSAVSDVELSIYNLTGQKVATLVSERKNAGHHKIEWDASGFASGVYYYRLEAGEFVDVKKMILLR